jgi:hypothetical protein
MHQAHLLAPFLSGALGFGHPPFYEQNPVIITLCVTSQDPGPSPGACLRRACTECCLLGMPACPVPRGESRTSIAVYCARVGATKCACSRLFVEVRHTPPDWPSNSLTRHQQDPENLLASMRSRKTRRRIAYSRIPWNGHG